MADSNRARANQLNAKKSTGPRTATGKARSSRNSLKHGLLSRELILDWEDEKEYNKVLNALLSEHSPDGATELLLVEQMAVSVWKLARLTGIETAVMNQQVAQGLQYNFHAGSSKEAKFEYAIAHSLPKNLSTLIHYESQLTKGFHRALSTLHLLQRKRQSTIEGDAVTIPDPKPAASVSPDSDEASS